MNHSPPSHPRRCSKLLRASIHSLLLASCTTFGLDGAIAAERNLADLSIEELMNETITSVSKKEQRLGDAAAAISVLTNDDLRRSGITHIADALRLVPGLNVGSLNASEWAISARGFNQVYANKLLVLIDGRAVYTALFGGVNWDMQQMPVEDIDRIEIIRGPGATLWGANAMNGVINIVTRSARDTQGAVAYGGFGTDPQSQGGMRIGDQLGEHTYYRAFADYKDNAEHPLTGGRGGDDGWRRYQSGFRLDRYPLDGRHMTWQADVTGVQTDDRSTNANNVNTLARWTERLSEGSSLDVQAYYDHAYRNEALRTRNSIDTFDVAAQHTFELGARHQLIWGAGYRFIATSIEQTSPAMLVNERQLDLHLLSAFVQDEYRLIPDKLTVTAGVKLEQHDLTGFEWQPSIRALFKPTAQQTLWAAVSRAVGTPNIVQATDALDIIFGVPFQGPGGGAYLPVLVGNRDLEAEVLYAYELGYRVQPNSYVSFDAALFYNDYSGNVGFGNIASLVPGVPVGLAEVPWVNRSSVQARGGEVAATISPAPAWRLTTSYSYLYIAAPAWDEVDERSAPQHQATLRSAYDLGNELSLNAQLRYVDSIGGVPGIMGKVDGYLTADVNLSYHPTQQLELTLAGRNLLRDQQLEQPRLPPAPSTEMPRSVYGKVTWRF